MGVASVIDYIYFTVAGKLQSHFKLQSVKVPLFDGPLLLWVNGPFTKQNVMAVECSFSEIPHLRQIRGDNVSAR